MFRFRPLSLALCAVLVAGSMSAAADMRVREFEDGLIVDDAEKPALSFALERNRTTQLSQILINVLYDPYGDPYVLSARDSAQPAAIDWGAEQCDVGGRAVGPFIGAESYRSFERWSHIAADAKQAALDLQRAWIDPLTGAAFILETAHVTVYEQQYNRRSIDINVRLVNVGSDPVTLPAEASFVVRFDDARPQSGFRTADNEYRRPPFQYVGPWVTGGSMSMTKMKIVGLALFNYAPEREGDPANFWAAQGGILRMAAHSGPKTLQPGDYTEWSTRVFCYADSLPARAIQDSYMGYLTGRTW